MKKISIVIPCYNEEKGIENLYAQLTHAIESLQKKYSIELILVNDGSTDNTLLFLNKYFAKTAKIISYEKNRNIGGALKEGFKHITGDIVITLDSDCTYPPKEIINLLSLLDDSVDIVTASPYHPDGKVANVPKYRLFLSRTVSLLYAMVLGKRYYTYTSLFRAYKKEVINGAVILHNGFIGVTELLVFAILKGYKVKEFPTTLHSRIYGQSKIKLMKTIQDHLRLLFHIFQLKLKGKLR